MGAGRQPGKLIMPMVKATFFGSSIGENFVDEFETTVQ
jgi:hypothetical protein